MRMQLSLGGLLGVIVCLTAGVSATVHGVANSTLDKWIGSVIATFPVYSSNITYTEASNTSLVTSDSALLYWYNWEEKFMHAVQPVQLDIGFISNVVSQSGSMMKNTTLLVNTLNTPQLRGILAMVIIGILYVILMPLIGIIWCLCRCCCSKNYQKYDKNGYRKGRCCLSVFTLAFVVIICSSATMSYLAGADLMKSANKVDPILQSAFSDTGKFVNDTGDQITFTVKAGFAGASQQIQDKLQMVGKEVGGVLLDVLMEAGVKKGLLDMISLSQMSPNVAGPMMDITAQADSLSFVYGGLGAKFDTLRISMGACVASLAAMCDLNTIRMNSITSIQSSIASNFPGGFALDLSPQQTAMSKSIGGVGFTNAATAGYQRLLNISDTIQEKTVPARANIITLLNKFEADLDNYLSPINGMIQPINDMLTTEANNLRGYETIIANVASYGNIAVIILATVILLIAAMMLTGCSIGFLTFDPNTLPTSRKGTVTCGNFCLLFAVCLILLFAWIFMLVTMAFFIVGTQADAIVCPMLRGADNNFTVMDGVADFVARTLNVPSLLVLYGNQSLQPGAVMLGCMENASLFTALNIGSMFNFEQIEQRMDSFHILSAMDGLKVSMADVSLFDGDMADALTNFMTAITFSQFATYLPLLDPTTVKFPYDQMKILQDSVSSTAGTQSPAFTASTANILAITNSFADMDAKRLALGASIAVFTVTTDDVMQLALRVKSSAGYARDYMAGTDGSASVDVALAASFFAQRTYSIAQQFVDHITETIKHDVGACRPVYDAVERVTALLCDGFLGPLNGFWFALGLALIIFIPTVCCNCRLAKYYRRAESTDNTARRATFTERRRQLSQIIVNNPITIYFFEGE